MRNADGQHDKPIFLQLQDNANPLAPLDFDIWQLDVVN